MVVDHVELVRARVGGQAVLELGKRLADPRARRGREHRRQRRLRVRVARGEERHLVPGVDEPVGEQPDDPLDPAVAGRRHREPDRADHGDAEAFIGHAPLHPHAAVLEPDVPRAAERAHARRAAATRPRRGARRDRRLDESAAAVRARGRGAPAGAAPACRPPRPAAAPRSGTRSGTASSRAAARRTPPAARSRRRPPRRASAGRSAAPPPDTRSARAPPRSGSCRGARRCRCGTRAGCTPASSVDIVRTPQPDQSASPISAATTCSTRSGRDDPAPEQVPDVRAERVDPLASSASSASA